MARNPEAPALIDALTRHQVYLEALKLGMAGDFEAVLRETRRDIRAAFLDLDAEHMGALTKRQLERFIRTLKAAQSERYNAYTAALLRDLRAFLDIEAQLQTDIIVTTQDEDTSAVAALLAASGLRKLWKGYLAAVVPATGFLPETMLERFVNAQNEALEALVRRGYANKAPLGTTLATLVGTSNVYARNGLLIRAGYQSRGLVATLLQHASGFAHAQVAAKYFDRYRWVSVLDSRTSEICQSRAGRLYRYGEGPLPPAHVNCRSTAVPYVKGEAVPAGYAAWLAGQPQAVQDDLRGLQAQDASSFNVARGLTLSGFANKLGRILSV